MLLIIINKTNALYETEVNLKQKQVSRYKLQITDSLYLEKVLNFYQKYIKSHSYNF